MALAADIRFALRRNFVTAVAAVLIVVLMFAPQGIFGRRERVG